MPRLFRNGKVPVMELDTGGAWLSSARTVEVYG